MVWGGGSPLAKVVPPPSSPESMEVESIGSDWEQLPSGGWRKPQAPPAPAVPPRQRPVKYVVGTLFEKHIIARIEDANNDRMAVLLERRRQREAAAMEREDCQAAPAGSAQRGNLPHPDQQRSGASQSEAAPVRAPLAVAATSRRCHCAKTTSSVSLSLGGRTTTTAARRSGVQTCLPTSASTSSCRNSTGSGSPSHAAHMALMQMA